MLKVKKGTAYIWEIKPMSTTYKKAKNQIDSYVNGTWVGHKNTPLKIGDKFSGNTFLYQDYCINYYYEKHGIIRYSYYEKVEKEYEPQSNEVLVYAVIGAALWIGICVALAPETGGFSLGGIVFA